MRKLLDKICSYEIINWDKINIYDSFFGGLFFTICHPFYSWKYDRWCYGSFFYRMREFFTRIIWKYLPFSKPTRWLGNMLVQRTYDSKFIDWNWASCYGHQIIYRAFCLFGYIHVYSQSTKLKKTIYKGWVFTKKKAFRKFKEVVENNKRIYNPNCDTYPTANDPLFVELTDRMLYVLAFGKLDDCIHSTFLEERFKKSKDNIEKLWCYVTYLLTMPNDFDAHENLAMICMSCEHYLFYKAMRTNPKIDQTYCITLKNLGLREANKWKNECVRSISGKNRIEYISKIRDEIFKLKDYYLNKPYSYYRI